MAEGRTIVTEDPAYNTEGLEFCCTMAVPSHMIDYNGHLNVGYYGVLFEDAARAVLSRIDLSRAYRERTGHALFAVESHMTFHREVLADHTLAFYFRLLGLTERAIDCMYFMVNATRGALAATQEMLYLHVNLAHRRVVPFPAPQLDHLRALELTQAQLPLPEQAGRRIELRQGERK